MKFYRDLFDASLNRVLPENDKRHFFETFWETFVHMSPETEQHFARTRAEMASRRSSRAFSPCLPLTVRCLYPIFWNAWRGAE